MAFKWCLIISTLLCVAGYCTCGLLKTFLAMNMRPSNCGPPPRVCGFNRPMPCGGPCYWYPPSSVNSGYQTGGGYNSGYSSSLGGFMGSGFGSLLSSPSSGVYPIIGSGFGLPSGQGAPYYTPSTPGWYPGSGAYYRTAQKYASRSYPTQTKVNGNPPTSGHDQTPQYRPQQVPAYKSSS